MRAAITIRMCGGSGCALNGAFVEVSTELGQGRYREVVGGAIPGSDIAVPLRMRRVTVPAGRFLSYDHDGPVEDIASGFDGVYTWADRNHLVPGPWKADYGYLADLSPHSHELLINIVD